MLRAVELKNVELKNFVLVLIGALVLHGCQSSSPLSPSPAGPLRLEDVTTSVSADEVPGIRQGGAAPLPSGGPGISATGNETIVNGGTMTVTVSSLGLLGPDGSGGSPFQTIYVRVAATAVGLALEGSSGVDGYYEVRLPAPATNASVLLTFPQEIALGEFELQFAAASPGGAVGPFVGLRTRVTEVGTGDVQVTLSWDADSDVDLHVVAPGGEEVFYGQRRVSSGGELDLDSNAACRIDGVRNENITWPVGQAPSGQYIVRVDYWSSCGVARTNYTVRINNGGRTQIFTGFFTGPGDQGGPGSGRTIATFER